jgi:hypothetical protein
MSNRKFKQLIFLIVVLILADCQNNDKKSAEDASETQQANKNERLTVLEALQANKYKQIEDKAFVDGALVNDKLKGYHSFELVGNRLKIDWHIPGYSKIDTKFEHYYFTDDTLATDNNGYKFYFKDDKLICKYPSFVKPPSKKSDETNIDFDDLEPVYFEPHNAERVLILEPI